MPGPEMRSELLFTFDSICRTDPGNGSVRPPFPNGFVYQTFGPSRLSIRIELMSTNRSIPLNADFGSSYATPATAPFRIDTSHAPPRARATGRKHRSTGRPTIPGTDGS